MSILLDALKKSEEQRQLGKVPGIHSPIGGQPGHRVTRQRWHVIALLLVCVVVLGWFGWRQIGSPDAADGSPVNTPAPVADAPEQTRGDEPDSPGSAAARRTPVESLPGQSGEPPATAVTVTAESPEPRKARVNQSFTAFEAVQEAATEPQQPQGPADSAPATAGAAAQPVAETPTAAASQAAQADPKTTEPISYWELPQGIRDSLPDLRITVLVYAESPENRFVLVGGQRLAEKDPYQEGVVLEEIRREGAVFLYRNYRFLVEG